MTNSNPSHEVFLDCLSAATSGYPINSAPDHTGDFDPFKIVFVGSSDDNSRSVIKGTEIDLRTRITDPNSTLLNITLDPGKGKGERKLLDTSTQNGKGGIYLSELLAKLNVEGKKYKSVDMTIADGWTDTIIPEKYQNDIVEEFARQCDNSDLLDRGGGRQAKRQVYAVVTRTIHGDLCLKCSTTERSREVTVGIPLPEGNGTVGLNVASGSSGGQEISGRGALSIRMICILMERKKEGWQISSPVFVGPDPQFAKMKKAMTWVSPSLGRRILVTLRMRHDRPSSLIFFDLNEFRTNAKFLGQEKLNHLEEKDQDFGADSRSFLMDTDSNEKLLQDVCRLDDYEITERLRASQGGFFILPTYPEGLYDDGFATTTKWEAAEASHQNEGWDSFEEMELDIKRLKEVNLGGDSRVEGQNHSFRCLHDSQSADTTSSMPGSIKNGHQKEEEGQSYEISGEIVRLMRECVDDAIEALGGKAIPKKKDISQL